MTGPSPSPSSPGGDDDSARGAELARHLAAVRGRIATACAEAGRSVEEVTLTVVTKYFPSSDVRLLAALGVTDVGENRHQEARDKVEDCRDLGLRWHFVGNLQSKKAAAVAGYVDVVESVDREKLVAGLSRGAGDARADRDASGRAAQVDCLVQVDLDPDGGAGSGRGGALPTDVPALAEHLAAAEGLRLRGVMAVAPPDADPRHAFDELARLAERVRGVDAEATWISAGMSGDLEAAVSRGATHVRIGSAVLGPRPRLG